MCEPPAKRLKGNPQEMALATVQLLLENNKAGPLMQLTAQHDMPELLKVVQSEGSDPFAIERVLMRKTQQEDDTQLLDDGQAPSPLHGSAHSDVPCPPAPMQMEPMHLQCKPVAIMPPHVPAQVTPPQCAGSMHVAPPTGLLEHVAEAPSMPADSLHVASMPTVLGVPVPFMSVPMKLEPAHPASAPEQLQTPEQLQLVPPKSGPLQLATAAAAVMPAEAIKLVSDISHVGVPPVLSRLQLALSGGATCSPCGSPVALGPPAPAASAAPDASGKQMLDDATLNYLMSPPPPHNPQSMMPTEGPVGGLELGIAGFGLCHTGPTIESPLPPCAVSAHAVPNVTPHDSASLGQQSHGALASHAVLPTAASAFVTPPRAHVSSHHVPAWPPVVMM
jgi:hypothetical protein